MQRVTKVAKAFAARLEADAAPHNGVLRERADLFAWMLNADQKVQLEAMLTLARAKRQEVA